MVLDTGAFAEALRAAAPHVPVSSVRPVYVRYKPGTSCRVLYQVTTAGVEVPVHATAYGIERRPLLRAPKRPSVPGPLGDGRFVVDDHVIEICVFPNDSALRALPRLADLTARERFLQTHCADYPQLWRSGLAPLAYKPGRRYVGLLTGRNGRRAVVKAYTADGYQRAQAGAHAFGSCKTVGVARELAHSSRHSFLVFDWLRGDRLAELVWQRRVDPAYLRRVGEALATLHDQPGSGLQELTRDAPAEALMSVARGIGVLDPELGTRSAGLAQEVATRLDDAAADGRPIHGDFYANQVLIAADAINIIDLDRAHRGDPRTDIGNFIAHLECDALEGRIAPGDAGALADALMDGYEDASHGVCRTNIDAFIAAGLLGLAPRPFRVRDADWIDRTAAILDRVRSHLDASAVQRAGHRSAAAAVVFDRFKTLDDRALSLPAEALDPPAMERRLSELPAFGRSRRSVRLSAIRVSRHKPGRRCLIEYDVIASRNGCQPRVATLIAKARSKGADTGTYRLMQDLWRAGFRDDSPDGIAVPEPAGVLPELKMWLQWRAPGTPAMDLLGDGRASAMARLAAAAISKLHATPLAIRRRHDAEDELRILRDRLAAVAAETPRWQLRLDAIFAASARLANDLPAAGRHGIHRDFHPGQVLVDGERAYLLDFDLYAAGDPALDVGNFLAHIAEFSLRAFDDPARLAACEEALTERYLASTPNVHARSIDIYKTLALARHIQISTRFPERRAFTERIIDLCEERLGLAPARTRRINIVGAHPR